MLNIMYSKKFFLYQGFPVKIHTVSIVHSVIGI